ncbi:hypothetical protein HMPREF0868_0767 [Mageeibacillus indolicus UPII9-5]|uniref:Uncharacterized protein n=1 Tax=Mageeibacillus indolicus (strain UPII9-5) TaxID=699246 RepID=D3R1M7_MAGIU|nr:DUF5685 family protein [Mageeibacillus indolicus]ADC90960.1 hypothetical protein HMPREF0868_0767 [Mageeibacillus indolicus UPII9-5]
MFGYIKPYKPDLTFRDFAEYRAVYCGLCKTIGRKSGQLMRLGLTYDATFMAILLLALNEKPAAKDSETCIVHPVSSHLVMAEQVVLPAVAHMMNILACLKLEDNLQDKEKVILSRLLLSYIDKKQDVADFKRTKASAAVMAALERLHIEEQAKSQALNPVLMGEINAEVAATIWRYMSGTMRKDWQQLLPEGVRGKYDGLTERLADFIGLLSSWVYFIDACDDFMDDKKHKHANPFAFCSSEEELWLAADPLLIDLELRLNGMAACLPWQNYVEIIANVIRSGLPFTRMLVRRHLPRPRL